MAEFSEITASLNFVYNPKTVAGRAVALVYELFKDKKISSADRDVLINALAPAADRQRKELG